MTNTVAYPDLESEKLIDIYSAEDPTALLFLQEKKYFHLKRQSCNK